MEEEVKVEVTVPETKEEVKEDHIALGLGRVEGLLTGFVDRLAKVEEKIDTWSQKTETAQETAELALSRPTETIVVEPEPEPEPEVDSEVAILELEPEIKEEEKNESEQQEPQKRPMTNLWHHL